MIIYLFWRKDTSERDVYLKVMYEHNYCLKLHIWNIYMAAKIWVEISYINWAKKLFVKYRFFTTEGASFIGLHEKIYVSFSNVF